MNRVSRGEEKRRGQLRKLLLRKLEIKISKSEIKKKVCC